MTTSKKVGLIIVTYFLSALCKSCHGSYRIIKGTPETRAAGCVRNYATPSSTTRSLSVYYNPGEGFYLQEGCVDTNATAYGYFAPTVNSTGWDVLEVATNALAAFGDNQMAMFAAGLLEGLLTSDRIDAHYANVMDSLLPRDAKSRAHLVPRLQQWLQEQLDWAQSFSNANPRDPLARNVGYLLAQLRGLINGYTIASVTAPPKNPSFVLQLTNAMADSFDILNILANEWPDWEKMSPAEFASSVSTSGHCSALIRLLPGLEDLLMSHNTWNTYSSTLRVFKHYNLRVTNDPTFIGGRQSFSGYPGTLASLDAFYTIDNRLVLLQTSNQVFNSSLFATVAPQSLLAWQRVRVANQLATSGAHWAEQFSRYNSGTYNNQYMVVDLNRFRRSAALDNGALTVVEQIPGLVRYSDQTEVLATGYWPSYNVPFHEDVYRISGYPEIVQKFGPDYSYQMAPRAKILRRDAAALATDVDGMSWLMRTNRYRTDPYSNGDPCKCLCCRGDIHQGSDAMPFGCYDAKVTSDRLLRQGNGLSSTAAVWAISGPTNDHGLLPDFSWTKYPGNVSHRLLPNIYNFPWVFMRSTVV